MKPRTLTQPPPTRSRPRARRTRPGFTLLEVALAALLGSLVIITTLALFTTMSRSQQRHEQRMQAALETATAHRTITRAMSNLLMHEGQEPREDELKKLRAEDTRKAEGPDALVFDERALSARFALQPAETPIRTPDGRPVQMLAVTLRSAPITAPESDQPADGYEIDASGAVVSASEARLRRTSGSARAAQAALLDQPGADPLARVRARRELRESERTGRGSAASSSNAPDDPSNKKVWTTQEIQQALQNQNAPQSGTNPPADQEGQPLSGADQSSPIPGLEETIEPGRAPGVRGVFELLPDEPSIPQGGIGVGAGDSIAIDPAVGLALWWRELPPVTTDASLTGQDAQSAQAEQADAVRRLQLMGEGARRVKLFGGLARASWSVYRNDRFLPKMSAQYAAELPAYVEFSYETLEGRREDWLFEVAWSVGGEPGTPLVGAFDPLNQGATGRNNGPGPGGPGLGGSGQNLGTDDKQPIGPGKGGGK